MDSELLIGRPPFKTRGISRIWLMSHMPRLVYAGEIGRHSYWQRTLPHGHEGIYHLFDTVGEVVYVGKTCNPFQRFIKHREKSWWWKQVVHLNFYTIDCRDHPAEPCSRTSLEKAAFTWELRAIRDLAPIGNTVGVTR